MPSSTRIPLSLSLGHTDPPPGFTRSHVRVPAYFYVKGDAVPPIDGDWGNKYNFWHRPKAWVSGLTQETCRDNNHHSLFGVGSAIHACEVAWSQGADLYSTHQVKRSIIRRSR